MAYSAPDGTQYADYNAYQDAMFGAGRNKAIAQGQNANQDPNGPPIGIGTNAAPTTDPTAAANYQHIIDTQGGGQPPPTSGVLSGPGPYEDWANQHKGEFDQPGATENLYSGHGQDLINQPSNAETLYSQGSGQLDPYYDYAQKKAAQGINDAAAARGGFNSSATLYDLGDSASYLRGQQAHEMGARAVAADTGKNNRYGASFSAANADDQAHMGRVNAGESLYGNWQTAEENRLGGALTSQVGIDKDKASAIQAAYEQGAKGSQVFNLEAANAALAAAGIDPNSAAGKDALTWFATIYKGSSS